MKLSFNVMFDGNCKEAVLFYAKAFKLPEPAFITYGQGDTSFDENVENSAKNDHKIMFSSLRVGDTELIFNDMPDNFEFKRGNSFGITVICETTDDAEEAFVRLGEGGTVFVPFAEIPGQGYFGMLGDKFNISWTIRA